MIDTGVLERALCDATLPIDRGRSALPELTSIRTNDVLFNVATSVLACGLLQLTSEDACGYDQTTGPLILH